MSTLAETVLDELLEALDNDELILPTLPEVALQVRETAENPNASIADLCNVIGSDAAISARLIKVVNSPLLRCSGEVTDLNMAISRLGINYTSNLATGLAMEQMFQATSDVIDQKMRDVWIKSTEIAGISHVLCRHYTSLTPDQATLAGLVHQIGVLPILTYAEESNALLKDAISLSYIIERIHPVIGEHILRAWDFTEQVAQVPGNYLDFGRQSNTVDYVDIVQVATLQSYAGSSHPLGQVDWQQVPAFSQLGIDVNNPAENDDLSETIAAARQMLQ